MESAYANDPRVVFAEDGTVMVPNPGDYQGDYRIEPAEYGGWTIRNDDHYFTDYNRLRAVWDTADEAIAFLIGAPQ